MFPKVNEGVLTFGIRVFNSIGFFVYVPLLSLWLVRIKNLDITEMSVVVAAFTFVSKAGNVLVGGVVNKLGIKNSLIVGLWGSALLLTMLTLIQSYTFIFVIVLLLGISLSLYNVSLKTHISLLGEDERLRAFALLNIAVNVGASIGPLLGGWLLDWNSFGIIIAAIVCYVLAGGVSLLLPRITIEDAEKGIHIVQFVKNSKSTPDFFIFIKFISFSGIFWFLYTQLFTTFPVVSSQHFSGKTIGLFFTVNAMTIIVLQGLYPKIQPKWRIEYWYALALMFITTSYFLLWISHHFWIIFVGVILFSIAEIIWVPTIDHQIVEKKGMLSSSWAFGVSGVLWGMWESIGGFVGLNLYEYVGQKTFFYLAMISAMIFIGYMFHLSYRKMSSFMNKNQVERKDWR
ncbi:MFS transporter [Anoxybacillus flavithermus]|uniref:Permease of the major facilitator superfamily n=1 Tax=Anoxybacillus flavithermus (strain DSM 21510 / WK1) TaxID=491915 RepID=B7GKI8_ANOFW|nr:MFS transporter [Anoxybacillus flavithermus]ACJ33401.1 Permease of the major facilitator superfamily [Anoxybacillus flavithermus WK1]